MSDHRHWSRLDQLVMLVTQARSRGVGVDRQVNSILLVNPLVDMPTPGTQTIGTRHAASVSPVRNLYVS
jgi:hypothetical protein